MASFGYEKTELGIKLNDISYSVLVIENFLLNLTPRIYIF